MYIRIRSDKSKQLNTFVLTRMEIDKDKRIVKVLVIGVIGRSVKWVAVVAIPAALEQRQKEEIANLIRGYKATIYLLLPSSIVGCFVITGFCFRLFRGKRVNPEETTKTLADLNFFNGIVSNSMLMAGMGLSSMFTFYKIARLIYKVVSIISDYIDNMDDNSKTEKIVKRISSKGNDSSFIESSSVGRRSRSTRDY